MKILGIETSCDETSASVVEDGRKILSNVVSSSLKDHQKYGGIIPEIASRRQLELIHAVARQALEEADKNLSFPNACLPNRQALVPTLVPLGRNPDRIVGIGNPQQIHLGTGPDEAIIGPPTTPILAFARKHGGGGDNFGISSNNLSSSILDSIDAIAVTKSPGLIGSLLVGISFTRALAFALKKPLIEVDHIKAHLYANFLRFKVFRHSEAERPKSFDLLRMTEEFPTLPAIGLVVSGGHSSLFHLKDFNRCLLLGQTRDDAVGEAYDKVARLLGLGYPGGPMIDRLAKEGVNNQIRFPCADLSDTFDFSFSGVKTAVLYHLKKNKVSNASSVKRIAYAFQESVVSVLVEKSIAACKKKKLKTLLIGGGVAANSALRQRLQWRARKEQISVFFPPLSLCTDNAAMIAGLAYQLRKSNRKS